MKKLFQSILAFLICIASLVFTSPPSSNALELTSHGKEALAQIAECVNRDDKDTLNVLYLIDESKSLTWNDPADVRSDALVSSLKQFADATNTRPFFKINRSFTTFASDFKVKREWKKLDSNSFESDKKWILSNIPDLENGSATDWEAGLRGALNEFAKVQTRSSCEVLVWFTDGGINVGNSATATANSLAKMCGSDPVKGAKESDAFINEFRKRGIWIQGILLRNQNVFDDPKTYGLTIEDIKSDKSRMTYFAAVVEQSSQIDPYFFGTTTDRYECGDNVEAFGLVQTVEDPVDIIWPTQQFNCLSTSGRVVEIKGNSFTIDPGITRFSVTTFASGLKLLGSNGEEIANAKGASKGNVRVESLNASNSVLQISGDISQEMSSATSSGEWQLFSSSNEKAVVCAYLDLELQVSTSTCYAGEKCEFSGIFIRKGLEADLSGFTNKKLQVGELKGNRTALPQVKLNGSSFKGEISPESGATNLYLGVLLTLKTQSGIEFAISTKKPVSVIPPGIYPTLSPNPITRSDFSQSLNGKKGEARVTLKVEGPSRTTGQICLGPVQVRSDALPRRIQQYVTIMEGSTVTSEKCFSLIAGEVKEINLGITNSIPAKGTSKGFLVAKLQADNQPEITSKIDVQFDTNVLYDQGTRWIIFSVLMILGIGLPLAGLYVANAMNAKIVSNNLYQASIPVVVSASGGIVSVRRLDNANNTSTAVIQQDDFAPFSAGAKKSKEIQIGTETLRARAPRSPFGNLKSVLTTAPSSVVISSSIHSNRGLSSNQAPGALNPAGMMYLVQSKELVNSVKAMDKGNQSSDKTLEARLVALLSFESDPYQQVEKLDSDIRFNSGWLNKLLDVTVDTQEQESLNHKKTKLRKSKIQSSIDSKTSNQDAPKSDDGWSTNTSPEGSSTTNVNDDWGNSSSASKDDDW